MIFDENAWRFINTFAPWLSAMGTITAVCVSLYLARFDRKIHLDVSVGGRAIIGDFGTEDVLCIRIVNVGRREFTVTNFGWKRMFPKKNFVANPNFNFPGWAYSIYSSKLPVRLKDGEEAAFYLPFDADWFDAFVSSVFAEEIATKNKLLKKIRLFVALRFLRIHVFTSVKKRFKSSVEGSFMVAIEELVLKRAGQTEQSAKDQGE